MRSMGDDDEQAHGDAATRLTVLEFPKCLHLFRCRVNEDEGAEAVLIFRWISHVFALCRRSLHHQRMEESPLPALDRCQTAKANRNRLRPIR